MIQHVNRPRKAAAIALIAVLGLFSSVTPSDAAVPGSPFTETGCEGHSDSVARLYVAAFGRLPEAGGFAFWVDAYATAQWSLPGMAAFFVESTEFNARFGAVDDSAFVDQLYMNVLGRGADAEGLSFWVDALAAGLSRGDLLLRFAESPENITNSGTSQPILGPFNAGTTLPFTCDSAEVIELCNAYLTYLLDSREVDAVADALGSNAPVGVLAAIETLQDPDADFFDEVLPAQESLSGYVVPICRTRWDRGLVPGGDNSAVAEKFFEELIAGNEAGAELIAPDDVRAVFSPWEPIAADPQVGSPSFSYTGGDTFNMLLGPTITVSCTIADGIVTSCGFGE